MITVPRPRRNRVTPLGTIEATPHRGKLMGNRGDLHASDGTVCRTWLRKAWLCCTLAEVNGAPVTFDRPGFYTPLFFADEAVALAAGHRPCASCRRPAYDAFRTAWCRAHDLSHVTASEIDAALHAARLDGAGKQRRHRARLGDLPDGVFVAALASPWDALRKQGATWGLWSHGGRWAPSAADPDQIVEVLTPAPIVAVLRAGYAPDVAGELQPGASELPLSAPEAAAAQTPRTIRNRKFRT